MYITVPHLSLRAAVRERQAYNAGHDHENAKSPVAPVVCTGSRSTPGTSRRYCAVLALSQLVELVFGMIGHTQNSRKPDRINHQERHAFKVVDPPRERDIVENDDREDGSKCVEGRKDYIEVKAIGIPKTLAYCVDYDQ